MIKNISFFRSLYLWELIAAAIPVPHMNGQGGDRGSQAVRKLDADNNTDDQEKKDDGQHCIEQRCGCLCDVGQRDIDNRTQVGMIQWIDRYNIIFTVQACGKTGVFLEVICLYQICHILGKGTLHECGILYGAIGIYEAGAAAFPQIDVIEHLKNIIYDNAANYVISACNRGIRYGLDTGQRVMPVIIAVNQRDESGIKINLALVVIIAEFKQAFFIIHVKQGDDFLVVIDDRNIIEPILLGGSIPQHLFYIAAGRGNAGGNKMAAEKADFRRIGHRLDLFVNSLHKQFDIFAQLVCDLIIVLYGDRNDILIDKPVAEQSHNNGYSKNKAYGKSGQLFFE